MSLETTKIAIYSNSAFLEDSFINQKSSPDIVFEPYRSNLPHAYVVIAVDLSSNLNEISQRTLSIYENAKIHGQKIAVILFHNQTVDREKIIYFENLLNKISSGKPLHRLVCTTDIYQTSLLYSESHLDQYLLEAIVNRKISISTRGKNLFFPTSIADLINCLKKILFLQNTAGHTFWVIGDPVTDLEIAYLIKKYLEDSEGPEFEIDASNKNISDNQDLNYLSNHTRALLNWDPKDDFSENLKVMIDRLSEDKSLLLTKLHHVQKTSYSRRMTKLLDIIKSINTYFKKLSNRKKLHKIENKKDLFLKAGEYIIVILSTIYLIFSIIFIVFSGLSLKYLENTLLNIREGKTAQSVKTLNYSKFYFQIGNTAYSTISPVISVLSPAIHEKNYNLFVFLDYTQTSLITLQQTYVLADKIYQTIGSNISGQYYQDASLALRSNLSQVYENINQIQLLTSKNKLPKILEHKLSTSEEIRKIPIIEQQITDILKTVELIPSFLSGNTAKNIVLLFQNSQELRSTGGALEYAMVIVMDQGRYISKNIYSDQELNNLALGKISAPPIVRDFTGDNDWKFRDLNYNPDYPQTAANISWYIEKTLKFKPDIILAVNDQLISNLLLEDKSVLIKGRQVTDKLFKQELNKKEDHLIYKDLISYYSDKIQLHQIPLVSLGRAIASQSKANQILYWTADKVLESSIIAQPFAGSVFPHYCPTGLPDQNKCVAQTTYLNESNFSFLPLTNNLKRKTYHKIWFENNIIHHEYTLQYQFSDISVDLAKKQNFVLQLYTPENATLEYIALNDLEISSRGLTMQIDKQLARFQIPVSLDPAATNTLVMRFDTANPYPSNSSFNYSLTEYRQPGAGDQDIQINIRYPDKMRPATITLPVQSGPDSLSFSAQPKTTTFGVSFTTTDR